MNATLAQLALLASWSIVPTLKVYQVHKTDLLMLSVFHSALCFALGVGLLALSNKQPITEYFCQLKTKPAKWWQVTFVIAALTVVGSWAYLKLTAKQNVFFLSYIKPLSLLITFAIASMFQGKRMTPRQILGVLMLMIGMCFFNS